MPSKADGDKPMRTVTKTVADAVGNTVARTVADEAALGPLARALASVLPTPAFVTLTGDLGAGKTTFVKAIAAAAGIDPAEVVSPTFGLIHVHALPHRPAGPERLVHADLYRLAGGGDLGELGWEDATTGPCWVFVEWPQRAAEALPPDRLDVTIEIDSETGRTLRFTPRGHFSFALQAALET